MLGYYIKLETWGSQEESPPWAGAGKGEIFLYRTIWRLEWENQMTCEEGAL